MSNNLTSRGKLNARILWPALGFPAVIAPKPNGSVSQIMDSDATRCICILLISNLKYLSKTDVSKYLRFVPWKERGQHFIQQGQKGSFAETDIAIVNDVAGAKLTLPGWKDSLGTGISFGGNKNGENAITVKLSDYVRNFYTKSGMPYLHEIRINEQVSGQLQDGQYNIFWNNENPGDDVPSAEMKLLLDKFALPRRQNLTDLWNQQSKFLLGEYEFEYGSLQRPYYNMLRMRQVRAEILHPLFVNRAPKPDIKIGHITDMHVNVRANVYEENLKHAPNKIAGFNSLPKLFYNNWNTSFVKSYNNAKSDSDVLLLTGDLIDYGRGHWGLTAADGLGDDRLYHVDRNWFLFSYLLSSGDAYQKPVYTILGNHDWRINPYPPFAISGAPETKSYFHNHNDFSQKMQDSFLQVAHGPGYDRKFSYYLPSDKQFLKYFWDTGKLAKTAAKLIIQKQTLNEPHLPVETSIDSVAWYLMSINPFLDYVFALPGGQKILMLDWAKDEDLFFPLIQDGKEWPFMPWQVQASSMPGPKARNSLTVLQKRLVDYFVGSPGKVKIIGIHAPPIGPYTDWYDYPDLYNGRKFYAAGETAMGAKLYATRKADGTVEKWNGHPIFATAPSSGDDHYGEVADYNSFQKERSWFIEQVSKPNSGIRIILAGHIHRNGLYTIRVPAKQEGDAIAGKKLLHGLLVPSQEINPKKMTYNLQTFPFRFPLYINTTCSGPRGSYYSRKMSKKEITKGGLTIDPGYSQISLSNNGTINRVEFRSAFL
jgi:hypothetical protein